VAPAIPGNVPGIENQHGKVKKQGPYGTADLQKAELNHRSGKMVTEYRLSGNSKMELHIFLQCTSKGIH
jgi:hypothetical protein